MRDILSIYIYIKVIFLQTLNVISFTCQLTLIKLWGEPLKLIEEFGFLFGCLEEIFKLDLEVLTFLSKELSLDNAKMIEIRHQ